MTVTYIPADHGDWLDSPDGAGRYRILRVHDDGGVTIEVELPAGVEGGDHRHPEGEELVMLSGEAEIGEITVKPGDYLHTPPGAVHRARAVTDSRFVLVLPAIPQYL